MRFPILTTDLLLADLRSEVRYTLAVLRHRAWAGTFVVTFEALIKEVDQAQAEHAALLDKLDAAAAGVDEADLHIDSLVEATAIDARIAVGKDTKAPLWRSLFGPYRPSELQRPKLGVELTQVRTWPELLRTAPTTALRDRAAECERLIKAADEAVHAQGTARNALQVFKSSKLVLLVAKLNAERSGLAGAAEKQAFDGKIRREAAQGLFRRPPRQRQPPADTITRVQAAITTTEAKLAELRQTLANLQTTDDQAAARRRADQETLTALQRTQAEASKKIAELEARLKT